MPAPHRPLPPPHAHQAALEQYRSRAPVYDVELALFEPIRRRAVAQLALQRGATVIDAGCGTGLSLPLLHAAVGAQGRIIGIEQSPEMLARARECVQRHGWRNVTLIEASVEDAAIEARNADAALFHFTHDILRTPTAVANVIGALRPQASVVACGLKWSAPWAWPVNAFVLGAALRSVSSLDGLAQPWSVLAPHLDAFELGSAMAGGVFIAHGRARVPVR